MVFSSAMSFDSGVTRSRMRAVKQLRQTNAQQLEVETKKMEDRIRSLKEQMVREKEEREKSGGIRWVSGRSGPLKHSQPTTKKKITKSNKQNPRKIKLLTDEPLSLYTKKATPRDAREGGGGHGAAQSVCGQCNKSKATLGCVECGENYCVSCFTNFHQKGALKKHSTRPVDQDKTEILEKKQPVPPSMPRVTKSTSERAFRSGTSTQKEGGVLLHGTFDEDESAASFAEALKEWRSAKQKKDEHVWVNPADTNKGTSCGTSTASEGPKTVEIKLNFGPNKSLNYLDRLLLKKHRENPAKSCTKREPRKLTSKKRENRQGKGKARKPQEDYSLMNYREIFQSLGKPCENSRATRQSSSRHADKQTIIEELTDDCVNLEETTVCVVQELDDTLPGTVALLGRPVSRSGSVSIMSMTSMGNFEEEANALVLEDLSGQLNSPVVKSTAQVKVDGAFDRTAHSRQKLHRDNGLKPEARRVWSPRPSYTGLSDFFLAGVKTASLPNEIPEQKSLEVRVHSSPLLCRSVWKPDESVCVIEVGSYDEGQSSSSPTGGRQGTVIPLVEEPIMESETTPNVVVSYSSDHVLDDSLQIEQESSDPVNSPRIHDFGIVDFLKTAPEPSKHDFSALHRVSTVTPLSLTSKPPLLWSDDESDDDLKALLSVYTPEDFDKADQDAADRATLDNLAWELASTTGRLTECAVDEVESCEEQDSYDEDSIEENDRGSGLSSPDELNVDSEDRTAFESNELEDKKQQSEVLALR